MTSSLTDFLDSIRDAGVTIRDETGAAITTQATLSAVAKRLLTTNLAGQRLAMTIDDFGGGSNGRTPALTTGPQGVVNNALIKQSIVVKDTPTDAWPCTVESYAFFSDVIARIDEIKWARIDRHGRARPVVMTPFLKATGDTSQSIEALANAFDPNDPYVDPRGRDELRVSRDSSDDFIAMLKAITETSLERPREASHVFIVAGTPSVRAKIGYEGPTDQRLTISERDRRLFDFAIDYFKPRGEEFEQRGDIEVCAPRRSAHNSRPRSDWIAIAENQPSATLALAEKLGQSRHAPTRAKLAAMLSERGAAATLIAIV
jgi:hypothetical protein